MGSVFRAHDHATGERAAVKVMRALDGVEAVRFRREAVVLARLSHPSIVRYIAHGETHDAEPWLAMEWLDGEDLSMRLKRESLPWTDALLMGARVAEALAVAHASSVVHRDVKPGNVLLVGGDPARAKILDFGVARPSWATAALTRTDAVLGTVGYMSPEQALGADTLDGRADLFSLGCVLYECLTGETVYGRGPMMAVFARLIANDPPRLRDKRPDLPERLDALLASMLSRDAAQRPADGLQVAEALRALASGATPGVVSQGPREVLTSDEQRVVSVIVVRTRDDASPTTGRGSEVRAAARSFAERLNGRVTNFREAMVVTFEGASADKAAACALGVAEILPEARVALAIGKAMVHPDETLGPAVESASGVLDHATGAGVWTHELAAALLKDRYTIRRSGEGLRLLPLEAEPKDAAGRRAPCVGRERELGLLESVLSECLDEGAARAVIVSAEAGAGKSRLTHEFVQRVQGRARAVVIPVDPVASASPLWLVRRVVRDTLGPAGTSEHTLARGGPRGAARRARRTDGGFSRRNARIRGGTPLRGPRRSAQRGAADGRLDPAHARRMAHGHERRGAAGAGDRRPAPRRRDERGGADGLPAARARRGVDDGAAHAARGARELRGVVGALQRDRGGARTAAEARRRAPGAGGAGG